MTTCLRDDVHCRKRSNSGVPGFNVTEWTPEEKVEIAKTSYASLRKFCMGQPVNIIDDGSNLPDARLWLDNEENVTTYQHRGSSAGINDYVMSLDEDIDMICHFEDDHVYFNPEGIDWLSVCYEFLKQNQHIGVVTLRSGLPWEQTDPGFRGAWGPRGYANSICPHRIYGALGNAHHIMLFSTYKKFFPLSGNTGGCEAFMNRRLKELNLKNAEIQIPVYAFHSHKMWGELPEVVTTNELNKTGRGIEYGIVNMYKHLQEKKPVKYSYFGPNEEYIEKDWPC